MRDHQSETVPPFLCNAYVLLWGYIVPQVVLVMLNLRGWWLIKGELNDDQQLLALSVFVAEISVLCVNSGLFVFLRRRGIFLNWKTSLVLLMLHVAYIWFGAASFSQIVPASVPRWIITSFNFFAWNITFFMPGAFLSLYLPACRPFRISKKKDALYTILAIIALPLAWYLVVSVLQPLFLQRIPVVVTILITIISLVILLGAVVRLFTVVINWVRDKQINTHYFMVLIFGLAAPMGGLYLNRSIPFPADFQSAGVYAFTLFNGLLLFARPGEPYSSLRLFARALAFPFIFYFFLVFLPFLPLAIFAIIALGTGFLVLTPVALCAFQTRIFVEDFQAVKSAFGKRRAVTLTLVGLLILPGYFFSEALFERSSLHKGIDYIYAADFFEEAPSQEQTERAARALLKLRDRKNGIQLPFLSGFYNFIVFGNMVLPDKKIDRMYQLFAGRQVPEIRKNVFGGFTQERRSIGGGGRLVPPQRDITLKSVSTKLITPGKATMRLVLQNQTEDTHAEYLALIKVPGGIFPKGLRLKIEDIFVAGKIFDRKTAMWVYKKITEFRQDPALMIYRSPNTLELRVYPFPKKGVREVEIDFLFPAKSKGIIEVSGQEVILNPTGSDMLPYSLGEHLVMYGDKDLPKFKRKPYLHFILDFSKDSEKTAEIYPRRIIAISKKLGVSELRLSAANLNYERLGNGEILKVEESEKITDLVRNAKIVRSGGFWAEQAIKEEMLLHAGKLREGVFQKVPVFVLVAAKKMSDHELKAIVIESAAFVTPDVKSWYLDEGRGLMQRAFTGDLFEPARSPELAPVCAVRRGSTTAIFNSEQPVLAALPGNEQFEYFDYQQEAFVELPGNKLFNPGKEWGQYANLWGKWRKAAMNPSQLEKQRLLLLEESRSLGMLIPTTSFIVVENTAQWRILERKEAQSLSNKSALEFEEEQTPEPPEWILILLVIFLTLFSRSRCNSIRGNNGIPKS